MVANETTNLASLDIFSLQATKKKTHIVTSLVKQQKGGVRGEKQTQGIVEMQIPKRKARNAIKPLTCP